MSRKQVTTMAKTDTREPNHELTTSSRMKTWFMVQFKGYTVIQQREVPKVTPLGRLTYENLWQLRSPQRENVHTP